MIRPDVATALHHVLRGLPFPAVKWQLIAEAELYGADAVTKDRLHLLPMRSYSDCADVTVELHTALAVRQRQRSRLRGGLAVALHREAIGHHPVTGQPDEPVLPRRRPA